MQKQSTGTLKVEKPQIVDLKTDTKGIITVLIIVGLGLAAFLTFVSYYALLWTPGKPLEMMQ